MNPLGRKGIEIQLIAELRRVPPSARATAAELRRRIGAALGGCSPAELAGAIQALRYQGKIEWDRIALSASMADPATQPLAGGSSMIEQDAGASAEAAVEDGAGTAREVASPAPSVPVAGPASQPLAGDDAGPASQPLAGDDAGPASQPMAGGPDEDDDYPGEVNDARPASHGFAPRPTLVKAGVHAAQTRAAARPLPAPRHEPEIARQCREEANELGARRRQATSTATVSQPLEVRKFGVPDLTFGEGVASLLVEEPGDLMAAIKRKHSALWRRVILLGRASDQRPAEALYAALERGLDEFEAALPQGEETRDVA